MISERRFRILPSPVNAKKQGELAQTFLRGVGGQTGNGENEISVAIGFDEYDNEAGEFFGLFDVHEVAGVFDDDAARIRNSGFDYAGVSVHVGDIDVAHEN